VNINDVAVAIVASCLAFAAVAARCVDAQPSNESFSVSDQQPKCVERETVPTAIPTEEWTPEWLSD